jgi:hypothetical protein
MKTYLEVTVSSEGEKASVITSKLIEMGFETGYGQHDFIYKWKKDVVLSQLLYFIDQVQERLKGSHVLLKFETV